MPGVKYEVKICRRRKNISHAGLKASGLKLVSCGLRPLKQVKQKRPEAARRLVQARGLVPALLKELLLPIQHILYSPDHILFREAVFFEQLIGFATLAKTILDTDVFHRHRVVVH
jgi:hypothetical protein